MSLFNDYSHQILHHQTERELIERAEHDRLARESLGADWRLPWWRRLTQSAAVRSATRAMRLTRGRRHYAH